MLVSPSVGDLGRNCMTPTRSIGHRLGPFGGKNLAIYQVLVNFGLIFGERITKKTMKSDTFPFT